MKRLIILTTILILASCAARGTVTKLTENGAEGDKIVALQAPNAPWVLEIQKRLQQKGFKVYRWSSVLRVSEHASDGSKSESYNKAETRYVLVIDGYAPLDWANRPFGGGYKFNSISVDVVDTKNNITMLNISGSGYSEGSPPASGTIFTDIVTAVDGLWLKK
jgi:hypothetical protein